MGMLLHVDGGLAVNSAIVNFLDREQQHAVVIQLVRFDNTIAYKARAALWPAARLPKDGAAVRGCSTPSWPRMPADRSQPSREHGCPPAATPGNYAVRGWLTLQSRQLGRGRDPARFGQPPQPGRFRVASDAAADVAPACAKTYCFWTSR
jgi:hypothetical protein